MATQDRHDDPARGLGPTRARVLALLQDAAEAMTAAQAGSRLGLHANSARFHLDALAETGLVSREREERTAPGRPKILYAASAAAPEVAHRSYRLLAEILTTTLAAHVPDPGAAAQQAGQAWGRYLTEPRDPQRKQTEPEAVDSLVRALGAMGFDSHVVRESKARSLRMEISHCPFLELATDHDLVCSIHLGLMRGVLEQADAPVSVDDLEPLVEPSRCVAHLSGV